ncbi:MAG TPA: hypothetical protein VKM54_05195 [Myxococcota bacterium]|nr:hypothetical protein [Myxococcota bacterium]
MRILKNGFLAAAASVLLTGAAHAVPLNAVAIPPSAYSISIAAGVIGTATGSGAITGTASTDITVTPTNVSTVGGSGSFDVADFTAPGSALGVLAFDNFHVDVTLPATTSTNGTNPFNPDLGGGRSSRWIADR